MTQKTIHHINNSLSVFVILLALYILFTPFLPEVEYQVVKTVHASPAEKQIDTVYKENEIPKENRLVIPQIGVDAPILEGASSEILDKGIWHRPHTSNPESGSNTVLVGHRFLYTSGPTTFYLLPKLAKGDIIVVYWNGKKYEYSVAVTYVVEPTDIQVESPSSTPELTLYTCTPLWNPIQRYVIKAFPVL